MGFVMIIIGIAFLYMLWRWAETLCTWLLGEPLSIISYIFVVGGGIGICYLISPIAEDLKEDK